MANTGTKWMRLDGVKRLNLLFLLACSVKKQKQSWISACKVFIDDKWKVKKNPWPFFLTQGQQLYPHNTSISAQEHLLVGEECATGNNRPSPLDGTRNPAQSWIREFLIVLIMLYINVQFNNLLYNLYKCTIHLVTQFQDVYRTS